MSVQHQPKDAKLNGTLNAGAVERETSASAAKNSSQSKAAHGQEAGAEPQSQARANARGKASKASTKARKADTVAKAPNAPPSEPAAKVKKVDLTSLASNSQYVMALSALVGLDERNGTPLSINLEEDAERYLQVGKAAN